MTSSDIINKLQLQPLPMEGGYYRETYRSADSIPAHALPERYADKKHVSTAIYYMLTPETHSALHRLPTDEIFHFYLGDPVEMIQLHPDGSGEIITLGHDILNGEMVQAKVPHGTWQGSRLKEGGQYALMGTTMAPGFDFSDFETPDVEELIARFPQYEMMIRELSMHK